MTTVSTGNAINVSYTVQNQGGAQAVHVDIPIAFYLSTDATITTGDIPLGVQNMPVVFQAGGSYSGSKTVTIPTSVSVGNYYVGAIVDYNNIEVETNESNNAFAGPTLNVIQDVDLVVTNLSATPTSVSTGDAILNLKSLLLIFTAK